LAELYGYVQRQLVAGHSQKSEEAFQQALAVLKTLAEAWQEVVTRTCGSVPSHSDLLQAAEKPVAEAPAEVAEPHAAYGGVPQAPSTSRGWSG